MGAPLMNVLIRSHTVLPARPELPPNFLSVDHLILGPLHISAGSSTLRTSMQSADFLSVGVTILVTFLNARGQFRIGE